MTKDTLTRGNQHLIINKQQQQQQKRKVVESINTIMSLIYSEINALLIIFFQCHIAHTSEQFIDDSIQRLPKNYQLLK